MNLEETLEKTTDPDFLQEMIGFTAQRLMQIPRRALRPRLGIAQPTRRHARRGLPSTLRR